MASVSRPRELLALAAHLSAGDAPQDRASARAIDALFPPELLAWRWRRWRGGRMDFCVACAQAVPEADMGSEAARVIARAFLALLLRPWAAEPAATAHAR